MQFHFKVQKPGVDPGTLILANQESMLELNFEQEWLREIISFPDPLTRQPEFFQMNDEQTVSIISSIDDGIYYNHYTGETIDLDELYHITNIKEIIHDHEEGVFYLLANKYEDKLGLFLIMFNEQNPRIFKFFMKWKNKLDIADASIAVLRNEANKYKELVVCYKTIYMNTYTVYVVDISNPNLWTLFRHESF